MTLSLVYRAARPSVLANPTLRVSLTTLSTRHASLSAIHRGLVRSEKARPQGARSGRITNLSEGAKRLNYAERRKVREQLAAERPDFKIRKGKKDITEYPDEAKAQSRRARFYDPDSSFGKKSLVYKLKTGQLGDAFKTGARDSSKPADSVFQRTSSRPDLRPVPRRTARKMARTRSSRGVEDQDAADVIAELSRPAGSSSPSRVSTQRAAPRHEQDAPRKDSGSFHRDVPRRDRDADSKDRGGPRRDRDFAARDQDAPRRDPNSAFRGRDDLGRNTLLRDALRRDRDAPRRDRDREAPRADKFSAREQTSADASKPRKNRDPISIPYTTAASQFLYGKSVVEAALRSSRRQLYKLYIYGGANRQSSTNDDALLTTLAKRKNIPVAVLSDADGLRLMDKLSASRPHNGFVLEASPLPQPPLAALGPLAPPDTYPTNPGYPVVLAHQSAEEAAVNGTPSFVPAPTPSHKPLVVVLDQILDPGNLGAILRTVSFLGATAVGITRKGTATLTPVALKASAGASETLTLFSVPNLPAFLNESRANGWSVYAAVAAPRGGAVKQRRHVSVRDVEETDPLRREPCVLVVGNEGEGLDRLTVKKADYEVNIPNLSAVGRVGGVDSLNVSVAVGLLCSAFLRGVGKEMEGGGGLGGVGEEGGGEGGMGGEALW